MKEFDYIIIGGGCAGLSLAYELEINDKLKEKTLAIIENLYLKGIFCIDVNALS